MREKSRQKITRNPLAAVARLMAVLAISASLQGCVGALFAPKPPSVAELMQSDAGASSMRALQMRRFDGVPEQVLQAAGISVIQDLGYQITFSDARLGLVTGRRGRRNFFEGLGEDQMDMLKWIVTLGYSPYPDPKYKDFDGTAAVLAIGPASAHDAAGSTVRIQFYRFRRQLPKQEIVWAKALDNADDYNRFFSLLTSAVALQAKKR